MLYQQTAEPLKLRLRLRSASATSVRAGGVRVDAVLCHVNMKTRFTAPLKFTQVVRFLPASLNRLRNLGFESGDANWSKNETGYQIDDAQAHSGRHSLRLRNATVQDRGSASQTITLNQTVPRPIVVRGHAKAENVSGHSNRTFAVYVDIYYTDGTPLYGQTQGQRARWGK
ncbi:MAG: hypothetical protein GX575_32065 [Candidatus Anammoximicrobium sp.]|nr:hypothetical protein [Candidatus Anammoximicrobium sp.]